MNFKQFICNLFLAKKQQIEMCVGSLWFCGPENCMNTPETYLPLRKSNIDSWLNIFTSVQVMISDKEVLVVPASVFVFSLVYMQEMAHFLTDIE